MQNRLVLKDGTIIINGSASRLSSNDQLMIQIPGNDLINTAIMFSNPEKTEEIVCYSSIYKITYTGYTDMYSIQYFKDYDHIELWLKPGKDAETSFNKELTVPKEYVPVEYAELNNLEGLNNER